MSTAKTPLAKAGVFLGSAAIGLSLTAGLSDKAEAAPAPATADTLKDTKGTKLSPFIAAPKAAPATNQRTLTNHVKDRSFAWAEATSSRCGAEIKRQARGVAVKYGSSHEQANRASEAAAQQLADRAAKREAEAVINSRGFKAKHCAPPPAQRLAAPAPEPAASGSSAPAASSSSSSSGSSSSAGSAAASAPASGSVMAVAASLAGRPYVWGATGPGAFDCSGYVGYVYRQATGKVLPRVSGAIAAAGTRVSSPALGDVVVFANSGGRVYHVGLYAGDGMMWHAPKPGAVVRKEAIWGGAWYVRV